jgi:hypothetical protein
MQNAARIEREKKERDNLLLTYKGTVSSALKAVQINTAFI